MTNINTSIGETPYKKTFTEIENEMTQKGYIFVTRESLTMINYKKGLFQTEKVTTKDKITEDIINKFKEAHLAKEDIMLVDDKNASNNQKAVFVFVKQQQQNSPKDSV